MNRIVVLSLFVFLSFYSLAQLCSGTLGAPIFWEDFGSGAPTYGSPLPIGITNYLYLTGPPNNGTYVISNTGDPSSMGYVGDSDHTGNLNGYMMVVNADYPPAEVYRKTVTGLCPNTTYVFSTWLANNNPPNSLVVCGFSYIYANVKLQVEYPLGTVQGSVSTGNMPIGINDTTFAWNQYGCVFTTGVSQTSCSVVLINNAPGGCGNDYVVDDITLSPCGPGVNLIASPSNTVCVGQPAVLQSSFSVGSYTVPQYQWQYSSNGSTWTNITNATSANYSLASSSFTDNSQYRLLCAENGNIGSPNCRIVAGPITFSVLTANLSVNSVTACSSQTSTLTAAGLTSYTWSTGPVTNSIIVSPTTSMSYTVYGSNAVCTVSATANVSVIPIPTISIAGNTIICPGATASLMASGATNYTWNPGGATGTTFTANPAVTTVYTLTGLITATSICASSITSTIIVPSSLSLAVTASSPSTCAGNFISLYASGSGGTPGYTYSWTAGPTGTVYNTTQTSGTYVYSVTTKDFINCSITKTISIDFINNPTVTVANTSICPGSIGTLTAMGANSYTWFPSLITATSFTDNPPATTVYSVTGTAVSGCTASATASIVLKPIPLLSFQTATITCANLGSATVTANGGIGPFSYTWMPTAQTTSIATGLYPGTYTLSVFDNSTTCASISYTTFLSLVPFTGTVSSTNSIVCNGVPTGTASIALSGGSGSQGYLWTAPALTTQTSATATALSAGIHTVSVTDAITFCNVTQTFQITQPPALTLNVNASAGMACVGQSIVLTATNSGGTPAYSYTWNPNFITTSLSVTKANGGVYTFSVQSSDSYSCLATQMISVTFVDYPIVGASGASICLGTGTVLMASGASSYTWQPGGFAGNNFSVSPLTNSTYTVTGGIYGCNSTTVSSVTVYTLPVPAISGTNVICEGQLLSLSGSGGANYLWSGPLSSSSSSPVFSLAPVPVNAGGSYSLTVTSSEGCSSFTSVPVTVLPRPVVAVTAINVCLGMSTSISASGGVNYLWSGPGGFNSGSALAVIPIVNTPSSIYSVVVTGSNSCSSTGSVQVIGFPYALPVPVITPPTPSVCVNSSLNLTASGGSSYIWIGPGNFTSTSSTLNLVPGNVNAAGIYTLSVRNNSNCVASTTINLTVYPSPSATLVSTMNKQCIPFCSSFYLDAPVTQLYPLVSIIFQLKGVKVSDSAFNYCFVNPGDYPVKAILTDINGCAWSPSLMVSAYPLPIADFEYLPALPVENLDEVSFTNTSLGASSWSWYFNNNNGDSSFAENPRYLYPKAGVFPIALVAQNKWGCTDTIVKTIRVADDFSFYVPNSFTPNADGINDIFQPKGVGVVKYTMQIFDRWGEKIFSNSDFYSGWDGSYKGKECKSDVYIWKAEVVNPAGKVLNYEGHVSLLEK